jgi:uncharacterized protein
MDSFRRALLLVIVAAALLPAAARAAGAAPSFDCARASTVVEHTICRIPQLADFDSTIAALYAQALGLLDAADAGALRTDQRLWLKVRDDCNYQVPGNPAVTTDVGGCLADTMATRVSQLKAIVAAKKFIK